jgi:hypothetical protein
MYKEQQNFKLNTIAFLDVMGFIQELFSIFTSELHYAFITSPFSCRLKRTMK